MQQHSTNKQKANSHLEQKQILQCHHRHRFQPPASLCTINNKADSYYAKTWV